MTVNQRLKVTLNYYPAAVSLRAAPAEWIYFHLLRAPCSCQRNTKEAGRCVTLSLELFKEHAAARLHANAVVTLVFLSAAAALTFCAG